MGMVFPPSPVSRAIYPGRTSNSFPVGRSQTFQETALHLFSWSKFLLFLDGGRPYFRHAFLPPGHLGILARQDRHVHLPGGSHSDGNGPLGGRFSDRVGVRIPATIGLALTALTVFSFTLLDPSANDLDILWRQVGLGLGISFFNPANNSAIIGSLPREKVGLASSFLALSRNLGMVIGVAFAEMVISFSFPVSVLERAKASPSLGSIQNVWKLVLIIGLAAILISWARENKSDRSEAK